VSDPAARLALLPALERTGVQIEVGPFLVRVRSDLPRLRQHLLDLYPDFPMRASTAGHFDVAVVGTGGIRRWVRQQGTLYVNGGKPYLPLPANLAGAMLEWGINWCIGLRAQRWLAIHAAVIERGDRVLILPAPSGSGKSTLCAALTYSGWRLFSDEFALVDPVDGRVWPAPRPLSLKERAIEIIRQRHPDVVYGPAERDTEQTLFVHAKPPAEAVRRAHEPARPGCIVIPRFVPSAPTTIEHVPRARALIEIADQSFNYNHLGPSGYATLVELVRASQCYRLEYSDLDDVLPRLAVLMDALES
jgi:HprK-related kinase A